MRLSSFIGLRFLRAKRQNRAISIITWISMLGVTLGVTALIIAVSVMNGFRNNLFLAVTGTVPHARVMSKGPQGMGAAERRLLEEKLSALPQVEATAPYLPHQAFLGAMGEYRAVVLRGIDPLLEGRVTELERFIWRGPDLLTGGEERKDKQEGLLDLLTYPPPAGQRAGIMLGAPLARSLGLLPGDELRLISTAARMTPLGRVPLMKQVRLLATFETGMSGTDELIAYLDYRLVQRLYREGDAVAGVAVKLTDPFDIDGSGLREAAAGYRVIDWSEENKNIFQVMRLEKLGVFLILILIIVVSFFNIISSLIMLVLEKRKGIAILKTMGATDGLVRSIFFTQGVWIGTVGTLGGLALGLAGCWVLATFDLISIPTGVFPLSPTLPVAVEWMDLLLIAGSSFLICLLVTIYPATRAARIRPVENLRYD